MCALTIANLAMSPTVYVLQPTKKTLSQPSTFPTSSSSLLKTILSGRENKCQVVSLMGGVYKSGQANKETRLTVIENRLVVARGSGRHA